MLEARVRDITACSAGRGQLPLPPGAGAAAGAGARGGEGRVLRRVLLALVALALIAPATASADPGFSCRGTGARIELAGNPQTWFVAGGGGPRPAHSLRLAAA